MSIRFSESEIAQIKNLYVIEKMTGYQVAKALGRCHTAVYRVLRDCKLTRQQSEWQLDSIIMGRKNWKNQFTDSCDKCFRNKLSNGGYIVVKLYPDNPFYGMGIQVSNTKYVRRILEHRLVMAKHLGRSLRQSEIIHHLNGVRTDNRICNLGLVTRQNHHQNTFYKLLQKRIRDLEAELSQRKLL